MAGNKERKIRIAYLSHVFSHLNFQWLGVKDAALAQPHVSILNVPGGQLHTGATNPTYHLFKLIEKGDFDGIICWLSIIGQEIDDKQKADFCRRFAAVPLVTLGAAVKGSPAVFMESYQGMKALVHHLLRVHGYTRLLFIRGPATHHYAEERFRAYCDALSENKLPLRPELISRAGTRWDALTGEKALDLMVTEHKLRPGRDFEAVVCSNDNLAFGAMHWLKTHGIRIPRDVAVTGFDDVDQSKISMPALTTVTPAYYRSGYKACQIMLNMLSGQKTAERVIMPSTPVIRSSCGCRHVDTLRADNARPLFFPKLALRGRVSSADNFMLYLEKQLDSTSLAWARGLIEALDAELSGSKQGAFLAQLDELLTDIFKSQPVSYNGEKDLDVQNLSQIIYALKTYCLQGVQGEIYHQAEALLQQALFMISLLKERKLSRRFHSNSSQNRNLIRNTHSIFISRTLDELTSNLVNKFHELGIRNFYMVLYAQGDPQLGHLVLAFKDGVLLEKQKYNKPYPVSKLLPRELLVQLPDCMALGSLHLDKAPQGFILFEVGTTHSLIFHILQLEISNAIKSLDLLTQIESKAQLLEQANKQIRQLNAQLKNENISMRSEMKLASHIQTLMLPRNVRNIHPDFDIAAEMIPATEVGGDYYDITRDREGYFWFSIGDVAGHGLTPGLVVMIVQTIVTTLATTQGLDAKGAFSLINTVLYKVLQERLQIDSHMTFNTLKYLGKGHFQHAGAHLDLVIYRTRTAKCELAVTNGTFLNFIADISGVSGNSEFRLDTGDLLILYSDGIIEAANPVNGHIFDMKRLCAVVESRASEDVEEIKEAILGEVLNWCDHVYNDDMTLMIIRYKGAPVCLEHD